MFLLTLFIQIKTIAPSNTNAYIPNYPVANVKALVGYSSTLTNNQHIPPPPPGSPPNHLLQPCKPKPDVEEILYFHCDDRTMDIYPSWNTTPDRNNLTNQQRN